MFCVTDAPPPSFLDICTCAWGYGACSSTTEIGNMGSQALERLDAWFPLCHSFVPP